MRYADYTSPQLTRRPAITLPESCGGVVLPAGWLPLAQDDASLAIVAACGFPTGRHHSLIKATEARLAVQFGATAVWLVAADTPDSGALLADIMATREAVPDPVQLFVGLPAGRPAGDVAGWHEVARTALLAGAQGIVLSQPAPETVAAVRDAGSGLLVVGPVGIGADIELVSPETPET